MWRDAVHLTDSGYGIIANLVLQSNIELSSKPEVPSSRLGKRPRDDHQSWQAGSVLAGKGEEALLNRGRPQSKEAKSV